MGRPLSVGDIVQCRYFNTPERRFYGETFTGEIVSIDKRNRRPFSIKVYGTFGAVYLQRKEILRRLRVSGRPV